jgi:hypothetical protein
MLLGDTVLETKEVTKKRCLPSAHVHRHRPLALRARSVRALAKQGAVTFVLLIEDAGDSVSLRQQEKYRRFSSGSDAYGHQLTRDRCSELTCGVRTPAHVRAVNKASTARDARSLRECVG